MIEIPDCFTNAFLEKVLRNGLKCEDVQVCDAEIRPGTSAGDNYCSEIYRASVRYRRGLNGARESISLIIKAIPYREFRGPALEELEVFDKEIEMYTKTLPRISRLLGENKICAKCFYSTTDPFQLIVFEDLGASGYMMADRSKGLDLEHCSLVLKFMARLHAASYLLGKKDPAAMANYSFGVIKPTMTENNIISTTFNNGVVELTESVGNWSGYQNIQKKLADIQKNYMRRLKHKSIEQQLSCTFNVLNHGDSWVNNFLFKYIEGRPISVIFVDYQMSYYSSPGLDLNYFIYTSPTNAVREQEYDELIDIYYDQLTLTLDWLRSKFIPKKEDIQHEVKRCEYYALMAAFGVLPFVILDESASKSSNLETLGGEESERQRKLMYSGNLYQTAIKPILKRFDESKLLDELAALQI